MQTQNVMPAVRPCIGGFLLLASAFAHGQSLDLLQAYRMAEESNPQLAVAREQRSADLEEVPRARSQLFPQVSASAGAFYHDEEVTIGAVDDEDSPFGRGGQQEYTTRSLNLEVRQALYRREAFIALRQARTVEDQAELEFDLARQELAFEVADAYFAVLEAADAVATFEAELRAVTRELARAERRRELGVGAVTEVNDSRARRATTRANLLRARNQLRLAQRTLGSLIQAPVDAVVPLAEDFEPQPARPDDARQWIEAARRQSRQVLLAELVLEIANAGVDAARAQRHPRIDLVANVRRDYQGGNPTLGGISVETDGPSVGVQVTVPLFLGGAIAADVRQSAALRNASRYRLHDTSLRVGLAAEAAFISLEDAIEQVRALEEALQAASMAEESTRRSAELGQRTMLDLLNVQRERYDVERSLAAARYQYLLAYLELRTIVGDPVEGVVSDVSGFLRAPR